MNALICFLLLFAACSSLSAADKPAQNLPIDLQPYRIKIELIFDNAPEWTPQLRQTLISQIGEINHNTYGEMWQSTNSENTTLLPRNIKGLQRLTEKELTRTYPESDFDKVFFCLCTLSGPRIHMAAREWDATLQSLSQIETNTIIDHREIPFALNRLINQVFRPICQIVSVNEREKTARIILKAGEFPARDPHSNQLEVGDLIQPYMRYLSKKKEILGIQKIDWNYLQVESIDRGHMQCAYISGVRTGLSSKSSRRTQKLGLRLRPFSDSTSVHLVLANDPAIPLVSHRVTAFTKKQVRDETDIPPDRYLSDRNGEISIPFEADKPVQWLYVNSGNALIGRVPVAPGTSKNVTCLLSDDSMRLEVEGRVEQLKGQIIEIIAQRASILAEARQFSDKDKWKEMNDKLTELERLDGIDELERRLNEIRVNATEKARKNNNRVGVRRIEKLSKDTSILIQKFLKMDDVNAMVKILKGNEEAFKKEAAEEARRAEKEKKQK